MLSALLLLGVGIAVGIASAEVAFDQHLDRSEVAAGEPATVMVTMINLGVNSSQVMVTPLVSPGLSYIPLGSLATEVYPGSQSVIAYQIMASQSGAYQVVSQISYTDEGYANQANLVNVLNVL